MPLLSMYSISLVLILLFVKCVALSSGVGFPFLPFLSLSLFPSLPFPSLVFPSLPFFPLLLLKFLVFRVTYYLPVSVSVSEQQAGCSEKWLGEQV